MKIISVTGTASKAGKTTIASYILRNLSNSTYGYIDEWEQIVNNKIRHLPKRGTVSSCYKQRCGALKITIRHEGSCPRHTGCDSCDSDYEPYRILIDDDTIQEKGKDTELLSRAGAYKVIWLQADSNVEKAGIEAALAYFDEDDTVVIEGNSFLRVRDANLVVLVASPSVKKIKRSTRLILDKIDIIAINMHENHTLEQIEGCKEQLRVIGCNAPFFLINPLVEDNNIN